MQKEYLIQTENVNCVSSQSIYSNQKPNELLYIYGSQIEGEIVEIHSFQEDVTYKWVYENGRYKEI